MEGLETDAGYEVGEASENKKEPKSACFAKMALADLGQWTALSKKAALDSGHFKVTVNFTRSCLEKISAGSLCAARC